MDRDPEILVQRAFVPELVQQRLHLRWDLCLDELFVGPVSLAPRSRGHPGSRRRPDAHPGDGDLPGQTIPVAAPLVVP